MDKRSTAMLAAALLGACGGSAETNVVSNAAAPAENVAVPVTPPAPGTSGGLPDDRAALEEPKGSIDPKSAEAAGQIVQSFGALVEQKRWSDAAKLWGDAASAAAFANPFKSASELHLQVGRPGDMEGAAGSSYVTVPVVLYGRLHGGGQFSNSGSAILRRVNDVPGSTDEQRRWHIERIEFTAAG